MQGSFSCSFPESLLGASASLSHEAQDANRAFAETVVIADR